MTKKQNIFLSLAFACSISSGMQSAEETTVAKEKKFEKLATQIAQQPEKECPFLGKIPTIGSTFKDHRDRFQSEQTEKQKKAKETFAKLQKKAAEKATATMWYDSPCGTGSRANAVQMSEEESPRQQSSTERLYNPNPHDIFP
ncbi:MAG: hypothetical protein WCD44_00410 [Candidatus Babeliales bacterium]